MKDNDCSKIQERLLTGGPGLAAEEARHVEHCPQCRDTQALVKAVTGAGDSARAADLSEEGVRVTRARVAEILQGKAETSWFRMGWGWAAAAALCIAAVFAIFSYRAGNPVVQLGAGSTGEQRSAADTDREIVRIQNTLDHKITQFQVRHAASSARPSFESRSRSVRDRIQMCSLRISTELAGDGKFESGNRLTL